MHNYKANNLEQKISTSDSVQTTWLGNISLGIYLELVFNRTPY